MRTKDGRDGIRSTDSDVVGRAVSDRECVVFILVARSISAALRISPEICRWSASLTESVHMAYRMRAIALALLVASVAMSGLQMLELFWVEELPGRVVACHPYESVSSAPQPGLPSTQVVRVELAAVLQTRADGVAVRVPTFGAWGEPCPAGQERVFIRPRLGSGALRLHGEEIDWGERFGLPLTMLAASALIGASVSFSDRKTRR